MKQARKGSSPLRKMVALSVTLVLAVASMSLVILAERGLAGEEISSPELTLPLNVLQDEGSFTFYLNEEVLVRGGFEWRADGSYTGDYNITMAGQTISATMDIKVDDKGYWTAISMTTAGMMKSGKVCLPPSVWS